MNSPMALVAELTYRCPLHCVYCSNPVEIKKGARELSSESWVHILEQAHELGILHVHFTGGEPCSRKDLETLVSRARALDLYTNLITSGIGRIKFQGLSPMRSKSIWVFSGDFNSLMPSKIAF